mgnify:CR=1 FL=1
MQTRLEEVRELYRRWGWDAEMVDLVPLFPGEGGTRPTKSAFVDTVGAGALKAGYRIEAPTA